MAIVEVGVNDGNVGAPAKQDAPGGFILGAAVEPHSVENNMVHDAVLCGLHEIVDGRPGAFACNLQSDETIVVGAVGKCKGAAAPGSEYDLRHDVLGSRAVIVGPSGQSSDTSVTRSDAS